MLEAKDKLVTKNRGLGSPETYIIFLDINQMVTLVMYNCKLKRTEAYKNITSKLEVSKEGLP